MYLRKNDYHSICTLSLIGNTKFEIGPLLARVNENQTHVGISAISLWIKLFVLSLRTLILWRVSLILYCLVYCTVEVGFA